MKLIAYDPGDSSAGIPDSEWVLEIPISLDDDEERDAFRKDFKKFLDPWCDFGIDFTTYEDECYHCGKRNGHWPTCPEQFPEDDPRD